MINLYLLRHGSTGPACLGKYIGITDVPLHESGFDAIDAWKPLLPPVKRVFCSPLLRTRQTAERLGLSYHTDPLLKEMDFGNCENKSFDEIAHDMPLIAASLLNQNKELCFPGGESESQFSGRIRDFLQHSVFPLDQTGSTDKPAFSVLLVTHAGVIRKMLQHLFGLTRSQAWDFQLAVASLCRLDYTANHTTLAYWNRSPQWGKSI